MIVNKLANKNIEESHNSKGKSIPARSRPKKNIFSFLLTFLIMVAIWVILSGKFDTFHLSLGVISCAIVAYFSGDLLFQSPRIRRMPGEWLRFIRYAPWLIYQVFLANLHLLYLVFHPRMHDLIEPKIFNFQSKLQSDISLVTLANSITLTPGTITVYASSDGKFSVHAIDEISRQGLPGEMEARVARAFGEKQ